jgi:hypothetical protein
MKAFLVVALLVTSLPCPGQAEDSSRFMVVRARIVDCEQLGDQVIAVSRIRENEPTLLLDVPAQIDRDATAKRIKEDFLDAIEAQEGYRPHTIEIELLDSLSEYRSAQKDYIESLKTLLANKCAPFFPIRPDFPLRPDSLRSAPEFQKRLRNLDRDLPDIPMWRLEEEIEDLKIPDLVKSLV